MSKGEEAENPRGRAGFCFALFCFNWEKKRIFSAPKTLFKMYFGTKSIYKLGTCYIN